MNNKSSFSHKKLEPESGILYLVATPIGNLGDISIRALNILKNVSLIACEDTRQTKKLLNKYDIKNNLISFNKVNYFKKTQKLINNLKDGNSIALVSDAGLPGICDPGEVLVREIKSLGLNIICIPGPSAVLTALVSSGFPSSKFTFEGFLPKKKKERESILLEISKCEKTTVLFESPHRLKKLLKELKEYCGEKREVQIFRELTKTFEEHIGSNVEMLLEFFDEKDVLGEITVVIKGIDKNKGNLNFEKSYLKKELNELISAGLSLSAASSYLAKKKNIPKNIIYNLY